MRPSRVGTSRRPVDGAEESGISDQAAVPVRTDETAKLHKIIGVLMDRVERGTDSQGSAFSLFQTAILLEDRVRERTRAIESALHELERTNRALSRAKAQTETAQMRLMEAIESLSEGFIQFDSADRLVLCNSKFLECWPGIDEVVRPGVPFEELLRWTIDSGLVAPTVGSAGTWLQMRLASHRNPTEPLVVPLTTGRWLQIRERLTRDGGTVGLYTDISEIKRSEERRREQELAEKSVLLQSTLDNIMQGVSVFDRDLRLVAWNDRFVDLLELPDWLVQPGVSFADYLRFRNERGDYGDDGGNAVIVRLESARQARSLHMEQTLAGGTVLEIRRDPMPQGGFVTTYADITDRREDARLLQEAKESLERRVNERTAELTDLNSKLRQEIEVRARVEDALRIANAEAEEANLSKTRFLAAASHDLLQPLNAARLFVTALLERSLERKEKDFAERIDGALRSVESVLGALLDISKFDSGSVTVDEIDFSVADLLLALQQEYEPLASEAGLQLKVVPSAAVVRTDPGLLGRILRNFVSNAIRYTKEGRVVLGCRRRGERIRIEIWDTGIGIPVANLGDIFEEFQQFDAPQNLKEKSFGLGLAIVKRIARMLGHRVDVRSQPGKGSVFSVEVPRGRGDLAAALADHGYAAPGDSLADAVVLVVENDDSILAGMRELLAGWGCRVLTATGPAAALAEIERARRVPDVMVADYHLDDEVDGLTAIETLRAGCGAEIPAMIITAERSPQILQHVRQQGYQLLKKPIKPGKLRALMSHLLSEDGAGGP